MRVVKKLSIIDQVVDNIKQAIINKDYAIGEKLPSELLLRQMLGVSRSTVRESFRVLQTQGFINIVLGKGAFVKDCNPSNFDVIRRWFQSAAPDLKDFFQVRSAIEGFACREAVLHCNDEQISDLEVISNLFLKAVENGDVVSRCKYDEMFHASIVKMCNNPLLVKIHNLIEVEFKEYRSMSFMVDFNAQSAVEPHCKIFTALKHRDGVKAEKEMIEHLNIAIIDMENIIK